MRERETAFLLLLPLRVHILEAGALICWRFSWQLSQLSSSSVPREEELASCPKRMFLIPSAHPALTAVSLLTLPLWLTGTGLFQASITWAPTSSSNPSSRCSSLQQCCLLPEPSSFNRLYQCSWTHLYYLIVFSDVIYMSTGPCSSSTVITDTSCKLSSVSGLFCSQTHYCHVSLD